MPETMPALFVAHGSPMNAILDNEFTRCLADWGARLPRPRAILVVSAHWMTAGTCVSGAERPRTIHDFYGFPEALYEITYPCPGAPEQARFIARTVQKAPVRRDTEWGLDHGAWSILRHLFPRADIPVLQLSLDYSPRDPNPKPVRHHYELAAELCELRRRGVLVIGSGNVVHNLSRLNFANMDAPPYPWAAEFDQWVGENLSAGNHDALIAFEDFGNSARLSVPTLDHYLPMLYVLGLREPGEPLTMVHEGMQHASISMRSFQVG